MTNYFEQCLADIKGAIPGDWVDSSYGNDACPSYETPNGWQIFIDHSDSDKREMKEMKRFGVIVSRNYGNGLGIDTPTFSSDSFQEILEYVSKPAPKYRETDDGTFEEVIAEKANIKRPQAIFRVEWEPEAYGNAPPRHVTWEELENDEETWNNILDEKFHTETVRHELSNLTHGTDLLYVGLEGWVRFFRLEEEAEALAYDAYFRNEGQVSPLVEYRVRRKQNYYEEMQIRALSEDEAIDRLRNHLMNSDEVDRKYVEDDGLVTADCMEPNLLRIRTGRSG